MADQLRETAAAADEAAEAVGRAESQAQTAGETFTTLADRAMAVTSRFAGFSALKSAITTTADLSGGARSLATGFGLASRTAANWTVVARANGVDSATLNGAFAELAGNAARAGDKAGDQARMFRQLGVSQRLLASGNVAAILNRTADGLRRMGPSLQRNELGAKLFGKQWSALSPLLSGGSRALNEQLALARKYVPGLAGSGNAAKALARAQLEQRIAMMGLQVTVGSLLMPVMTRLASTLSTVVSNVRSGHGPWRILRDALRFVADQVRRVVTFFSENRTAGKALMVAVVALRGAFVTFTVASKLATVAMRAHAVAMTVFRLATGRARIAQLGLNMAMRANVFGLVVTGIVALGAGLVLAYKRIRIFRNAVNAVWGFLKKNWPKLLAILTGPIGVATLLIVRNWGKIRAAATSVVGWVRGRFSALVGFIKGLPGKIAGAATGLFDGIKDAFKGAINWIIGQWNNFSLKLGGGKVSAGPLGSISIPSVTLSTPDIPPLLAKGGIVTGSPGGQWITGEAGPELNTLMPGGGVRVDPLGGRRAPLAAEAPQQRELHVHVNVDRRELTRAVLRGLPDLEAFAR
jgi:hypothetical protein